MKPWLLIAIHFDPAKETVTASNLTGACPGVAWFQLGYLIIAIARDENLDLVVCSLQGSHDRLAIVVLGILVPTISGRDAFYGYRKVERLACNRFHDAVLID